MDPHLKMLKLSVIVPAYNEEATIIPILELVNAQKLKTVDLEVLVVDDGSNDRTVELLEAHPALYSTLIKLPKKQRQGRSDKGGIGTSQRGLHFIPGCGSGI